MSYYRNDPMDYALCGWGSCQARPVEPRIPLCDRHLTTAWRIVDSKYRFVREAMAEAPKPPPRTAPEVIVYYIQMASGIKIGATTNLSLRVSTFAVLDADVLACEPGGYAKEGHRHKQFAHLRIQNEMFTDCDELRAHIASIREAFGNPWELSGRMTAHNLEIGAEVRREAS